MICYLTQSQYRQLWDNLILVGKAINAQQRIEYWKIHYCQYHIQYDETRDPFSYGYWGMLEGEEKYINWFLLQYA
jgi:hypothetical protein